MSEWLLSLPQAQWQRQRREGASQVILRSGNPQPDQITRNLCSHYYRSKAIGKAEAGQWIFQPGHLTL